MAEDKDSKDTKESKEVAQDQMTVRYEFFGDPANVSSPVTGEVVLPQGAVVRVNTSGGTALCRIPEDGIVRIAFFDLPVPEDTTPPSPPEGGETHETEKKASSTTKK